MAAPFELRLGRGRFAFPSARSTGTVFFGRWCGSPWPRSRDSVLWMSRTTRSGSWFKVHQVNRRTVHPASVNSFCRRRSSSKRSWSVWNANPSISTSRRTSSNTTSPMRLPEPKYTAAFARHPPIPAARRYRCRSRSASEIAPLPAAARIVPRTTDPREDMPRWTSATWSRVTHRRLTASSRSPGPAVGSSCAIAYSVRTVTILFQWTVQNSWTTCRRTRMGQSGSRGVRRFLPQETVTSVSGRSERRCQNKAAEPSITAAEPAHSHTARTNLIGAGRGPAME